MNGLLLVNKESGISSAQLTRIIRRITGQKKVGHTGTLDLLATGLLVVALGRATKLIEYLQEEDKEYIAEIQFQIQKDTVDDEGIVIASTDRRVEEDNFYKILNDFIGEIEQKPPMHSALKYKGKRLYEYAREGISIDRKTRKINIYDIQGLNFDYENQRAKIKVSCSAGTYIRSLVEDIGFALDNLAYMKFLKRVKCSGYTIENSIIINEDNSLEYIKENLIPMNEISLNKDTIYVDKDQAKFLKNGMTLVVKYYYKEGTYMIKTAESLLGLANVKNTKKGSLLKLSKHLY